MLVPDRMLLLLLFDEFVVVVFLVVFVSGEGKFFVLGIVGVYGLLFVNAKFDY